MRITECNFGGALFAILLLTSVCSATESGADRVRSISQKLKCSCGCGEILQECSHKECERKPGLQREIAAAIDQGKTDDQILDMLAKEHGDGILLAPRFSGFNTLLWLVPAVGALAAVGFTMKAQRRRAA